MQAPGISKNLIRLYGILGNFFVLPNTKWNICHFSTKASSNDVSDGGNCLSLLKELRPVRERVQAEKINDMSSLLQRDLSDFRVANDLIPYLLNNQVGVGFFPGILVALVPKGFLSSVNGDNIFYPKRDDKQEGQLQFGDYWSVDLIPSSAGGYTALGQIAIDPEKTDLIVLDGQHRANAFRYITNTFEQVTGLQDTVYKPFYSECVDPNKDFDAELPVTLVWFEPTSEEDVTPLLISRRLFVDVNTNAKTVNESRNILLDDHSLSKICTNNLYSKFVLNRFDSDKLSLLHSGFDSDGYISSMHLFTPSMLNYSFCMFAIGRDDFDNISTSISRDSSNKQNNHERLLKFFECLSSKPNLNTKYSLTQLHDALSVTFSKYVFDLLSNFNFIKMHIKATSQLAQWISSQSTSIKNTWSDIYCSGEGLYSNYRSFKVSSDVPKQAKIFIDSIDEIEKNFREIRGSLFTSNDQNLVDEAFKTFSTKATITGLLMALSFYAQEKGWTFTEQGKTIEISTEFCNLLNKTDPDNWLKVLTKMKKYTVGTSLDPKKWIHMRNIFLRVIENNSNKRIFYV